MVANLGLLSHTAGSQPDVLAAAARRVDIGTIEAQVVRVRSGRCTRPEAAIAALILSWWHRMTCMHNWMKLVTN